jgi:hypothetical protein
MGTCKIVLTRINTLMNTKTKTLLEELVELAPSQDTSLVIESRGTHIIASAIRLLETVQEHYGNQLAEELEKRLLSSIRNRNNGKFIRATKTLVIHPKNN